MCRTLYTWGKTCDNKIWWFLIVNGVCDYRNYSLLVKSHLFTDLHCLGVTRIDDRYILWESNENTAVQTEGNGLNISVVLLD